MPFAYGTPSDELGPGERDAQADLEVGATITPAIGDRSAAASAARQGLQQDVFMLVDSW